VVKAYDLNFTPISARLVVSIGVYYYVQASYLFGGIGSNPVGDDAVFSFFVWIFGLGCAVCVVSGGAWGSDVG
jgi:hypothetical protein